MKLLSKYVVFLMIMFLTVCHVRASLRTDVNEGKTLYEQQKYDEALKKFMDTEIENPGEPILEYNIGNTLYKQNRYDEAIEHYKTVLLNADKRLSFQANYNIGNCMYNKALQTESTGKLDQSIKEMKEGLEYYKAALSKKPDDIDAKFNTEFLQKEIKRLLDKINQQQKDQKSGQQQKEQQQNQQQQNQQQQKGQQGKQEKDQKKSDKNRSDRQKQQSAEKENDTQAQQAEKQDDKSDKNKDKQAGQKEQKQELSKKEAERLLKNMKELDKKRENRKSNRGYLGEVEKDW